MVDLSMAFFFSHNQRVMNMSSHGYLWMLIIEIH